MDYKACCGARLTRGAHPILVNPDAVQRILEQMRGCLQSRHHLVSPRQDHNISKHLPPRLKCTKLLQKPFVFLGSHPGALIAPGSADPSAVKSLLSDSQAHPQTWTNLAGPAVDCKRFLTRSQKRTRRSTGRRCKLGQRPRKFSEPWPFLGPENLCWKVEVRV